MLVHPELFYFSVNRCHQLIAPRSSALPPKTGGQCLFQRLDIWVESFCCCLIAKRELWVKVAEASERAYLAFIIPAGEFCCSRRISRLFLIQVLCRLSPYSFLWLCTCHKSSGPRWKRRLELPSRLPSCRLRWLSPLSQCPRL